MGGGAVRLFILPAPSHSSALPHYSPTFLHTECLYCSAKATTASQALVIHTETNLPPSRSRLLLPDQMQNIAHLKNGQPEIFFEVGGFFN